MSAAPPALGDDDLTPLLQATASRSLDTCLRGARGLAMLGDPRAFGLLLQLSREDDAAARVEVCRALAALDDPRADSRLRSLLFDAEATVRDAAYSALARLQTAEPLRAAEAGLNAAAEDVRRRGLQTLLETLRQKKPAAEGPVLELLGRALNDSFAGVRTEAFKAALNLQVAGGGLRTLRFVLGSVHADIRREVLTEATAQANEPWAWNLVLEFYNDPDPKLREEAFAFAVRKSKELPPLEAALPAQYPDVRKLAVDALVKKHTAAAQALLVKVLADPDKDVRQLALAALVGDDARGPLTAALASPFVDVRVRAARALARHGDAAALAPLLALATAPEPAERERRADWLQLAEAALQGLAELGEPSALAALASLLQSEHVSLRKQAARALAWVALPHQQETLRQALQHADAEVKYAAALGLAYAGDASSAALVFSQPAAAVLWKGERLAAAFALGAAGEDQLAVFLDDAEAGPQALLLHLLRELADRQGAPARCLACLSARSARVRLTAARALENFADPATFRAFVVEQVNDRGDEPAWKVPAEAIDGLANLLAHGAPAARARSAHLAALLVGKEQAPFDQAWKLHATRFAVECETLANAARQRKPLAPQYTSIQLRELAFGAYVGLVREQGGGATTEPAVVRVRQTALTRVQAFAASDARHVAAVRPVLMQALGDPNQAVRIQAFDQLTALGVDADALGAAALGAGHTDVGVRGLEALAGGGKSAAGQAVLEEALRTRTDDLATEAAKLLAARRGVVPVAGLALAAAHEPLRKQAVEWLAAEYDKSPAARDLLRQALTSRHRRIVAVAAEELAAKRDAAAFDALVTLLGETKDAGPQRRMIEALKSLGDARTPDALLERMENDPEGTAPIDDLFAAAASFRRPESAERLLRMAGNEKWLKALDAAHVVSGFDQPVEDPEEENADRRWEEKQRPRHSAVLARLMTRALELKRTQFLAARLPDVRWARAADVDPVLALLAVHADNDLRHAAVEVVGWRLRKRKGPADVLVKLLQHRDPATQLLAAEGLARAGRAEGLSALLAAVDLQDDPDLRRRAVAALGELGDARAVDLLLKIVNDPAHELQDEAAEALGHLGRSAKADEILQLLEGLARGSGGLAERALKGLRWLDHPAGWQLIRRRAAEAADPMQDTAIEQLGYHDEPATRDLLLKVLAETDHWGVFAAALTAARKLWGLESLEPDYAALQNQESLGDTEELLRRVRERGDAKRMLEILPKLSEEVRAQVKDLLLRRQPLPVKEAQAVVAGADAAAAGVAAHVLGRAGEEAAKAGLAIAAALKRWWTEYDERRQDEARRGAATGSKAGPLAEPLRSLTWAAGRLGVAADTLLAIAAARPEAPYDRPLRRAAVAALAEGKLTKPAVAALEAVAGGDDPEARALAAEAVARHDAKLGTVLAGKALADRATFNRLGAREGLKLTDVLRGAAVQVHYQGVAVPHLAARGDVAGLAAVAANKGFTEEARIGAVEGLAAAASEAAEAELVKIGTAKDQPEELRKAAWRGLRRSKRTRVAKSSV